MARHPRRPPAKGHPAIYTLPADYCGPWENTAVAKGYPVLNGVLLNTVYDYSSWTVNIFCGPGTGTPGYWMNHPEAWPVESITIGGITYPKMEAIGYMLAPVIGDKTFTMFPALVAARLNVLIGNNDSCIAATITEADGWISNFPLASGVEGWSEAWQYSHGEQLYLLLDAYSNGDAACASSRDDLE